VKIKIKILPSNSKNEIELKYGSTIYDILKKIRLNPDTVIVLNNNKPVPVDDIIKNNKELTIIQVASGG